MRSETDARSLASMNLPDGFDFFQSADTAELRTPEGRLVRFSEGYTVSGVERAAAMNRNAARRFGRNQADAEHMTKDERLRAWAFGADQAEKWEESSRAMLLWEIESAVYQAWTYRERGGDTPWLPHALCAYVERLEEISEGAR